MKALQEIQMQQLFFFFFFPRPQTVLIKSKSGIKEAEMVAVGNARLKSYFFG